MKYKIDKFEEIKVSYTFKQKKPWRILKKIELELSTGDIVIIPKDQTRHKGDQESAP